MDIAAVFSERRRRPLLAAAVLLTIGIAAADWYTEPYASIGFLYFFPILLVAAYLRRWQIALLAFGCAGLQERFANLPPVGALERLLLSSAGFLATGLFISELLHHRRSAQRHLDEIEQQVRRREEAEQQLRILVDTSPAAILTVDGSGRIVLANSAAQELVSSRVPLEGQPIASYLPAVAAAAASPQGRRYRASLQCRGTRANGEVFLAAVWFSTYDTGSGHCLAAIAVDLSEDVRSREELGLDQALRSARVLMGAVSHEVRNLCGAALAVHRNLAQVASLRGNEDFAALGTVIEGLERLSSLELKAPETDAAAIDLAALLDELRVLIEPAYREAGLQVRWEVGDALPAVWADRYGLLQAFLNLARNSQRALAGAAEKRLTVSTGTEDGRVLVRFLDTGPGVAEPERLFRPFQPTPGGSGLGLYVSRTVLRSFGGDLAHVPGGPGSCFVVSLRRAPGTEAAAS